MRGIELPQARAYSLRVPGRKVGQTSGARLWLERGPFAVPDGVKKGRRRTGECECGVSEWQSRATKAVVMSKVVVAQDNWEGNRESARGEEAAGRR